MPFSVEAERLEEGRSWKTFFAFQAAPSTLLTSRRVAAGIG
jgi:hypothetical protein